MFSTLKQQVWYLRNKNSKFLTSTPILPNNPEPKSAISIVE